MPMCVTPLVRVVPQHTCFRGTRSSPKLPVSACCSYPSISSLACVTFLYCVCCISLVREDRERLYTKTNISTGGECVCDRGKHVSLGEKTLKKKTETNDNLCTFDSQYIKNGKRRVCGGSRREESRRRRKQGKG